MRKYFVGERFKDVGLFLQFLSVGYDWGIQDPGHLGFDEVLFPAEV